MGDVRKAWTEREINLLKKMVKAGKSHAEIAEKTGHSMPGVKNRISRMGLGGAYAPWTDAEVAMLIKNQGKGWDVLCELLPNRNAPSISAKAGKLGIVLNPDKWTDFQEQLLKKYYPTMDIDELVVKIGKTELAVRMRAVTLKIKRADHYWDRPEEEFIMKNWDTLSVEEIAEKVKKSKWAVYAKRRELLNKNPGH